MVPSVGKVVCVQMGVNVGGDTRGAGVCVRGDMGCFPLGRRTAEADKVPNCRMTMT